MTWMSEPRDELKHALKLAREDLSFAVDYCNVLPYRRRLIGTIDFITKTLGDEEEFKKIQERWKTENEEIRYSD